jgi:hypothetical protein
MITAVDTNVLLDVFGADPEFGQRSAEALRACQTEVDVVTGIKWAFHRLPGAPPRHASA